MIKKIKKQKGRPLSDKQSRKIRDKFYTTEVQLFLWNQLKKRHFEIPGKKVKKNKVTLTLSERGYNEMIDYFFKVIVRGTSNERFMQMEKIKTKSQEKDHKYRLYKGLVRGIIEKTEYRLPLWLPLSLEEKLDMLMHQRNDDEAEMMIFLIENEYEMKEELPNLIKAQKMVESAL